MKSGRLLVLALVVGLSAGVGWLLAETERGARITGVDGFELRTLEWRQRLTLDDLRSQENIENTEIVLVLFDSASVGRWPYLVPFPRPFLAEVIDAVAAAGARTIGLDVYLDRLYPELNAREGGDDRLREAIAAAGNVILVAPVEGGTEAPRLALPHPFFTEVAAGVGAAEVPTPFETVGDGVLAVRSGEGMEPSFALALWAHSRGANVDSLLAASWASGVIRIDSLPGARIPPEWIQGMPGAGFALTFPLRFVGPPSRPWEEGGSFPAHSTSYVESFRFMDEWFKDRIVLIGSGFHDSERFRSPFYDEPRGDGGIHGWTYGVEVHAHALQNFLGGSHIRRLGPLWGLLLMIALPLLVAGAVFRKGATWGAGAGLLAAFGLVAAAAWAYGGGIFFTQDILLGFGRSHLWIPIVPPIIATFLSYAGSAGYVSIVEGRDKRFIRSAFGKYVSPAVVAEIGNSPESLKLGGQKRPLSILFSDLAGFTSLSENLDPEALITLLNEYLSEMTTVVMEEDGTLDKYIGDAIMAFWNAPKDQPDHADRALRCAIRMQERMVVLNRKWAEEHPSLAAFRVRIGVNTGPVVVGNVGGVERFDYSAIGDAVNLAARLEPANDSYGTLVMTSAYTLEGAAADAYRLRELDLIAVKGKSEPVRVFEVVTFAGTAVPPGKDEALRHYELGLAAYRSRAWAAAADHFCRGLEADPEDGPIRLYLTRARDFMQEEPAPDWDFVVRRTTK